MNKSCMQIQLKKYIYCVSSPKESFTLPHVVINPLNPFVYHQNVNYFEISSSIKSPFQQNFKNVIKI